MIVQILGTGETVEIPDEPHPITLELEAFGALVRTRLKPMRPVPPLVADKVSRQ